MKINNIYYKLIGNGKPLVFIHGILGFWRNFYNISQSFSEHYTSLLYDQRGHGRSFHQEPYSVLQLAQDLKALLDHLKWNKVTLIGHSLGAYVSFLFAQHYPEGVKKMIIVDGSPWPQAHSANKIRNILSNLPPSFSDRAKARDFFKQSVENNIFSKTMADFLMASLKQDSNSTVKFLFDNKGLLQLLTNVRENDYPSLIKTLKMPILVLRGENSTHFPGSDFEKALKLNPLIKGQEIKNSGHWIHSEQPKAFKKALKDFLKRANMSLNQTAITQNFKKAIQLAGQKKGQSLFVFDLDSTLFCMKHRTQAIIRSCINKKDFCEKFLKHLDTIKKVEVTERDWSVEEIMSRYGFSPEEPLVLSVKKIWKKKFFTNDYLDLDRPYKGCVKFVQYIAKLGAKVLYLTARNRGMYEGTVKSLRNWDFPLEDEKHLIMKDKHTVEDTVYKDSLYKIRHLQEFVKKFDTVSFFENEPVILNEAAKTIPQIHLFWMDSVHSRREKPPKSALPLAMNYVYPDYTG